MKHLLNNLTEEEKNSIRGQHTDTINVVTENFSKLVSNKLGNVKTLVSEQEANDKEPVTPKMDTVPKGMLRSCDPTKLKRIKDMFFGAGDMSIKIENNVYFGEGSGAKDILFVTAEGGNTCWCRKADFQKL